MECLSIHPPASSGANPISRITVNASESTPPPPPPRPTVLPLCSAAN